MPLSKPRHKTKSYYNKSQTHGMAQVDDPDSWKRFSRATHQDEEMGIQKEQTLDIRHSSISPSERKSSSSPPRTPTTKGGPLTLMANSSPAQPSSSLPKTRSSLKSPVSATMPATTSDTHALLDLDIKEPLSPTTEIKPMPRKPAPTHPYSHRNGSQLTLGFSGRPASRFKFWTQISSDPTNRNSWLEAQQRKKQRRTWICWMFWLCLLVLGAGAVVCVLLLRERHVI